MKENKILLAVGGGCAAILAVLGLVVFWQSPDYYNLGELFFFKRQLVSHGVGIAVALGAAMLGWRRMVRGAPWICGAFLATTCLCAFTVGVGRCSGNSNVGSCWVNVWSCVFAVASLALAGVTNKRLRWCLVYVATLSVAFGCYVLCSGDAIGLGFAQQQLVAAWDSARWFGGCGASLREVPMAFASGMTSGAGVVSGWLVSVLGALAAFGLAAVFFVLGVKRRDWGRRLFGLSFGTFLAGQTAVAFLQCVGWMPMTRCVIPLFAFGVMQSIITWFAVGLGVAAILDDREGV